VHGMDTRLDLQDPERHVDGGATRTSRTRSATTRTPVALSGKTVSGGVLDVAAALGSVQ